MMANEHRTGRVNSGDVSIFYRAFGARGRTPILVMHGANYFDSYDWISVAGTLASDREVVAFDRRGWGESTWSPSKDYSLDAHMSDALAVVAHMRWEQVLFMGHSASGRVAMGLAANFLDKAAGLIIVDSPMGAPPGGGQAEGGAPRQPTGNPPLIFESIDAAMASFAKLSNPPRIAHDRERAQNALIKLEQGYMLKRDPDNGNNRPQGEGVRLPPRPNRDIWQELAAVKAPAMYMRGLKSDRLTDEMIARLRREYPKLAFVEVDSQHDVAYQAPDALIANVRKLAATV
jgi:pimeloyl-ACP methyl ester carboxylesterase